MPLMREDSCVLEIFLATATPKLRDSEAKRTYEMRYDSLMFLIPMLCCSAVVLSDWTAGVERGVMPPT
jgi:hypothetical protein